MSQEELLRQPVYIPFRQIKDPRTILMLDPACGSMHFGLYSFDLYERIYEEAWELEGELGAHAFQRPAAMAPLRERYPDKASFLRDVPRLIIEHNIHGIDIDPRAVQIAGLSLWLRAQKSWQVQGLKPQERPTIRKSNIVCAEPMPGDKALLEEFLQGLRDDRLEALIRRVLSVPENQRVRATPTMADALCNLVRTVWEEMKLAGEAGSLLKIEELLTEAIAKGRVEWEEKMPLFRVETFRMTEEKPKVNYVKVVPGEGVDFWERAEALVLAALEEYVWQADNNSYQRRLFAEDAARGFAFIDLCRKRYDVALMNPPFGEVSLTTREYLYKALPESSRDIFASFVSIFTHRLVQSGRLGALTNRLAFFNEFLALWRENLFMGKTASMQLAVDLGYGVLDAVVETAAYVCSKSPADRALFLNTLRDVDKQASVLSILSNLNEGKVSDGVAERDIRAFASLPGNRFAYTLAPKWLTLLNVGKGHNLFSGKGGICTGDDFRFYRCFWEIDRQGSLKPSWRWLAKGGDFSRYRTNTHLVIDWKNEESLLRTKNSERYGEPGATYTYRTTSNLSARVLNERVCFSQGGPGIIANDRRSAAFVLAYMNSYVATYCLENMVGGGDFSVKGSAARNLEPRYLEHLPRIQLSNGDSDWFHEEITKLLQLLEISDDEAHPLFCSLSFSKQHTLRQNKILLNQTAFNALATGYEIITNLEQRITQIVGLKTDDVLQAYSESGWPFPDGNDIKTLPFDSLCRVDGVSRDEPKLVSASDNVEFRFQNKLSHYLHADIEHLAHLYRISPKAICLAASSLYSCTKEGLQRFTQSTISHAIGCNFGRWEIGFATGEKTQPILQDPFAPLPVCPPGMLQNSQGLPATPNDVSTSYPLRIAWPGILVDDNGHPEDIELRMREVLRIIWPDRADDIEQEACEILGVASLRAYFANPNGFFDDHLKRYSKSRRAAPIYWPLATPSGSYTLWLYYHRLTDQTLYSCVNDFVEPKLKQVNGDVDTLRRRANRSRQEEKELEQLSELALELAAFRDELLRIARFWQPNLNDGVQITAAPLWRLFQHRAWQKRLKETWTALEAGDYDWAHLAYSIWPERVREKCKTDKSLAIAHDLEQLYVEPIKPVKAKKGGGKKQVLDEDEQGELL